MNERDTEDLLRKEYFEILPEMMRVTEQLRAEIQFQTLPIVRRLSKHGQLVVKARTKDCGSAIDKLRRKQESREFSRSETTAYSLTSLNDLAAVRVLVFPRSLMDEVDELLSTHFSDWTPDPIRNKETDELLAYKYHGLRSLVSGRVRGEYQIVSMLTGLFWEVEHAALYKLSPSFKGIRGDKDMNDRTAEVYKSLTAFEDGFEQLISKKDKV